MKKKTLKQLRKAVSLTQDEAGGQLGVSITAFHLMSVQRQANYNLKQYVLVNFQSLLNVSRAEQVKASYNYIMRTTRSRLMMRILFVALAIWHYVLDSIILNAGKSAKPSYAQFEVWAITGGTV